MANDTKNYGSVTPFDENDMSIKAVEARKKIAREAELERIAKEKDEAHRARLNGLASKIIDVNLFARDLNDIEKYDNEPVVAKWVADVPWRRAEKDNQTGKMRYPYVKWSDGRSSLIYGSCTPLTEKEKYEITTALGVDASMVEFQYSAVTRISKHIIQIQANIGINGISYRFDWTYGREQVVIIRRFGQSFSESGRYLLLNQKIETQKVVETIFTDCLKEFIASVKGEGPSRILTTTPAVSAAIAAIWLVHLREYTENTFSDSFYDAKMAKNLALVPAVETDMPEDLKRLALAPMDVARTNQKLERTPRGYFKGTDFYRNHKKNYWFDTTGKDDSGDKEAAEQEDSKESVVTPEQETKDQLEDMANIIERIPGSLSDKENLQLLAEVQKHQSMSLSDTGKNVATGVKWALILFGGTRYKVIEGKHRFSYIDGHDLQDKDLGKKPKNLSEAIALLITILAGK